MKPRILVLTKLFWPEGSGAELATYLVVKDILSKHFDVTIVSGTRNPKPDILKYASYIHWGALEASYKPIEWIKTFTGINWVRNLVGEAGIVYIPSHTLIPLAIAVKALNPRAKVVLHLHNYQLLTYTSVVLANREPDIATDIIIELGEHKSLLRALLAGFGHYINYVNRLAAVRADRIICVSRKQCEIILKYIPGVRNKTEVIYNPIPPWLADSKPVKTPSDTPTFLYVGGGRYVKGFYILVEAMERLGGRGVNAKFLFANTYDRESLKALETLSERFESIEINVIGRVSSHEQLLELQREAWASIFPSIWEEPLPYAIVEAMLAGTIPIASKVGGVPEMISGSPAEEYLFTPGDINEFIDRIEKLLSQPRSYIMENGMKLRERAFRLLNKEWIESEFENLFKSLLSQA
jgi:glycosyltransferase involved in cell wall biosynthesis